MKRKTILISLTLIIIIVIAGSSMAWQTSKAEESKNRVNMGTVKLGILEGGPKDIKKVIETTYEKSVQVENLGTENTYVRVRIVPEWSEASLPVSNVELNLSRNGNWTAKQEDGYYYFKNYLTKGQVTSSLLDGITFKELDTEYEEAEFSLKVVIEGVQVNHGALKDVWGLKNLPFTPGQPLTP